MKQTAVPMRPFSVAVVAVATAVLAACGTADSPADSGKGPAVTSAAPTTTSAAPTPTPSALPTVSIPPVNGPHNDIDVMFATDMIPHHRQAVEMAVMAKTRANDPRVKAIAARIEQAQDAEVTLMSGWLKAWGQPVPAPDKLHTSHGPGMMSHAEMEDLKAAEGRRFDGMFAEMMIRHHKGALEMADITKTPQGQNPAVRALATNVVITQTAEVAELTQILGSL